MLLRQRRGGIGYLLINGIQDHASLRIMRPIGNDFAISMAHVCMQKADADGDWIL